MVAAALISDPARDREDTVLALRTCDGDELAFRALCNRFESTMSYIVSRYYVAGEERDDLIQEARIALHGATISFDPSRGVPFAAFAALAIRRRVISLLKAGTRHKCAPLQQSVRFQDAEGEDAGYGLLDVLAGGVDPVAVFEAREEFRAFVDAIATRLTPLERGVVVAMLGAPRGGQQYAHTMAATGLQAKQIDNALGRVRRKLREAMAA